jgi:hypothetical protein
LDASNVELAFQNILTGMLCPSTSPTEPRQQEQSATLSSGHARPTERVAVPAKSNTPPLAPLPAPRAVLRQAEKLANARQKSTASSPARPSTRARAARTSSAASARPCRSSRRPTQSRRRDAARRTHGVTMYCTCTLVATCDCDCDCGASTTRYACHVQCNATVQICPRVMSGFTASRMSHFGPLPSFNVGFLFLLPPHSPLQAPGCAGRAGLEV